MGVAEVGTVDVVVGSVVEGDVVGVGGVVIVGEGEVGVIVTTVVGVPVEGLAVLFCGVTGVDEVVTGVVGAGVTCTLLCKMGDPVDGSVPEPDCSTLLSLPWSARA